MKIKIFGGLAIALAAITSMANAQPIRNNQHNQERRIYEGERSGRLTRAEARDLQYREEHLAREKRMAMADGRITYAERQHLLREEAKLNRAIYDKKNNYRRRG